MKKLFTLLFLCLCAITVASATETTFDLTTGYTNQQVVASVTSGPVSITFDKGKGTTTPAWYSSGTAVRIYKLNTVKFTASANITKVVFTFASSSYTFARSATKKATFDVGSYTESSATGTWTGSANTFTITGADTTGHARIQKIVVTTDGGTAIVSDPVFSPASGTFYAPFNATITSATDGAAIHYTTDGTDPTASSTLYSAAIPVSATTTIKAIAVKDTLKSNIKSATYTFATATSVANIAAYQKVADSTVVQFANPVNVLAFYNKTMFVKDNSGYMIVYGTPGVTYKNGDVIPAGFVGKKVTYNGEPELSIEAGSGNFAAASSNTAIAPETVQANDVAADMFGHYVYITGAKLSKISGSSFTLTDNSGSAAGYANMGASVPDSTKTYNITGIVSSYCATTATTTTYRISPTKFVDVNGSDTTVTKTNKVASIKEFNARTDNDTIVFTNPVNVLAQSGNSLYTKDATGYMIIYGSTGKTYKNGDVIPAGFGGKKVTYNGYPEMGTPLSGFAAAASNTPIKPDTVKITDVKSAIWGDYVFIKNVKVNSTKLIIVNGTDTLAFYSKPFAASVPADTLSYNVAGIVSSHSGTMQLLPIAFTKADGGAISTPEVANLKALLALASGVNAKVTGAVTVEYQNGKYLYIKDATANALVFGTITKTYNNGDQITGIITNWTEYNGVKELIPIDSTFTTGTAGTKVSPAEVALEDISQDMIHAYVIVKNASIKPTSNAKNLTVNDGTIDMTAHLQFTGVAAPTDTLNAKYSIEGFVGLYSSTLQLYPTTFTKTSGVNDINADAVKVTAANGTITVAGAKANVYTIAGALVAKNIVTVAVPAGVYIVKAGAKAVKVFVK
jgi:hypothetical protein